MRRRLRDGVTLVELLIAMGIFSMVMTAILSFYVHDVAVSAKRDEQSERLRRFHLGLTKIENALREGRLIRCGTRVMTLIQLTDLAELDGFPQYQREPLQFVSTKEGVVKIQAGKQELILPVRDRETVLFGWVDHNPPYTGADQMKLVQVTMYREASAKSDELNFRRVLPVIAY